MLTTTYEFPFIFASKLRNIFIIELQYNGGKKENKFNKASKTISCMFKMPFVARFYFLMYAEML